MNPPSETELAPQLRYLEQKLAQAQRKRASWQEQITLLEQAIALLKGQVDERRRRAS